MSQTRSSGWNLCVQRSFKFSCAHFFNDHLFRWWILCFLLRYYCGNSLALFDITILNVYFNTCIDHNNRSELVLPGIHESGWFSKRLTVVQLNVTLDHSVQCLNVFSLMYKSFHVKYLYQILIWWKRCHKIVLFITTICCKCASIVITVGFEEGCILYKTYFWDFQGHYFKYYMFF